MNVRTNIQPESKWDIIVLLKDSYENWKHKFLSYLLIYVFLGAIWVGSQLGLTILAIMIALIIGLYLKSSLLISITIIISVIISCIITVYLFSYATLANVRLLTDKKIGVISSLKSVKPLIKGYIWVGISSAIFLIGIFPFGLLSFLLIPLVWTFWSSFTTFVYLDYKKRGLQNLWTSKTLYFQKFNILFTRNLILFIFGLFISVPHFIAAYIFNQQSLVYNCIYVMSYVFNLIYMSFLICFNYELYKKLEKTKDCKPPKGWIALSIVGWIANVILIITIFYFASQLFPELRKIYFRDLGTINQNTKYSADTIIYNAVVTKPIQTQDRIFTLLTIQGNYPANESDSISDSQKFILVNVSIENTSTNIINFSPYDLFIQDGFRNLIGPTFAFRLSDVNMIGSGKLLPGAKKTGAVVFKVEKSNIPFTLLYKPQIDNQSSTAIIQAKL